MIIAGATAYPRIIDPGPLREIADEVGALLMFDAAHIAGLIAGGVHPNPVPYADIVTFTTHKTLRGPRGGCILATAELGPAIDKAMFPGLQGGPLEHVIAAKAVAFREAAQPDVPDYAAQIVAQRRGAGRRPWPARASAWCRAAPTTTCMLVDLRPFDAELTGKEAQAVLDRAGITLNKNTIPDDPRRRSSPAACASARRRSPPRAWPSREMAEIAALIARALRGRADDAELAAVRDDVATLCSKFTPYV